MKRPVKLILDTDLGADCDDAGALAVLHALAKRGEVEIAGITYCTSSPFGPACIDAINRYYGCDNIPIGTMKQSGFLDEQAYRKFDKYIAEHYPNRFVAGEEVPDAVILLRNILSQAADNSVVIAAIGPLPNLKGLLQSIPDQYSVLNGVELVKAKVSELVVMGGKYPEGSEWNFEMDPASAQYVADHWPSPIMFSGFEIGDKIITGACLYEPQHEHNPVRKAYELFARTGRIGRNSWDLTAVLYAVRGLASYWEASEGGYVLVDDSGANTWVDTNSDCRRHRYLQQKMSDEELRIVLDELIEAR